MGVDGVKTDRRVSCTGDRLEMKTHTTPPSKKTKQNKTRVCAFTQAFSEIYVQGRFEITFPENRVGEFFESLHVAAAFPPCHLPFKLIVIV